MAVLAIYPVLVPLYFLFLLISLYCKYAHNILFTKRLISSYHTISVPEPVCTSLKGGTAEDNADAAFFATCVDPTQPSPKFSLLSVETKDPKRLFKNINMKGDKSYFFELLFMEFMLY